MGVREYDYIRGNTALVPERKIKEKERNREQEKRDLEKKKHLKRKQSIKSIFKVSSLAFLLASVTLLLNGYVYNLQENLSNVEENITEQKDINEALKVEMLKFASFDTVKNTAEKELGMVYPNEKSTITIDMSKEYFSHIKDNEENESNLIAKLMKIFN